MKPAVVWTGIIVGLLAMSFGIHAVLLFAAINDPSFAVEPDYERKAANWDEIQRQRAKSAALGWEVALRTVPASEAGRVEVSLTLADRNGRPISDARVELETFHNARAGRILRGDLPHVGEGLYRDSLAIRRPGVWEFRVLVVRGDDRYTGKFRKSVATGPAPGAP